MLTDLKLINSFTVTTTLILVALWLSRVIYSIYFSPLSDIPSPLFYQFFPWYYNLTVAKGDTPFILDDLHKKYGPIFRVGWEVVMIVTPEACSKIYSNYGYTKGRFYSSFNYFGENLLSDRTRQGHSLRKRLVAPAFTKANVKLMEPVVNEVGLVPLLNNLENHIELQKPIDLFHQFHYMSWDIIGELGFGQSFKMLKDGNHPAVDWLSSTLNFTMFYNFFPFLSMFRVDSGEKLREFNNKLLDKYFVKLKEGKVDNSLLRFLVNARDKVTGNRLSRSEIFAETHLMLFAGTDTTSNSLTLLFYQLMKHPEVDKKLYNELRGLNLEIITNEICRKHCPYLNAVIKEAMRLLPAVAGTPLRFVPEEGATFLDFHLPYGTQVGVPLFAIQRSELIWPRADEFLPERWLETDPSAELFISPNMQKSFIPFLIGPNACAGKNLADLEINVIAANLLRRYRFLPLKSDGHENIDQSIDQIIDGNGEMELVALPILRPKHYRMMARLARR